MSLEKIFEALINLGFAEKDALVYVHLATKGPKKAIKICGEMGIKKQQLISCWKSVDWNNNT